MNKWILDSQCWYTLLMLIQLYCKSIIISSTETRQKKEFETLFCTSVGLYAISRFSKISELAKLLTFTVPFHVSSKSKIPLNKKFQISTQCTLLAATSIFFIRCIISFDFFFSNSNCPKPTTNRLPILPRTTNNRRPNSPSTVDLCPSTVGGIHSSSSHNSNSTRPFRRTTSILTFGQPHNSRDFNSSSSNITRHRTCRLTCRVNRLVNGDGDTFFCFSWGVEI